MEGQVIRDEGLGKIETSAGDLILPSDLRARIGRLSPRDRFAANVWIDPSGGLPEAASIRID
jgi:hypothetical protein